MRLFLIFFICLFSINARGIDIDNNARLDNLYTQIKCPTCVAQNIKESDTRISRQIKAFVKHKVFAGSTDEEILNELRQAYGDDVIFNPNKSFLNSPLWVLPFALIAFIMYRVRRYIQLN